MTASLLLTALLAGSCASAPSAGPPLPAPQEAFFAELQRLCGRSFTGSAIEAPATDTIFSGRRLSMEVRECTPLRVIIPVAVGDDRSRTWIVSRETEGLRLTHIHLRSDGTEDSNSRYGGVTLTPGTPTRQDFPADTFSIRREPGRETQTWTMEVEPGVRFDYSLHRVATGLRIRFRFDL